MLAHELAHIVLEHSLGAEYASQFSLPFSDLEIFAKLNFRFDPAKEADADRKGQELFSKSPYKDKAASVPLFLKRLEAGSARLPGLLQARFSNDFGSSHLVGMQALVEAPIRSPTESAGPDCCLAAGFADKVDPWSDRIEMLKSKPPLLESASENRPFEVSPFFPYLKRLDKQKHLRK